MAKTRYLRCCTDPFKQCDNKQLWISESKRKSYVLSYNTIVGYIDWRSKILHASFHWYSVTTTRHINYTAKIYGLTIKYDYPGFTME